MDKVSTCSNEPEELNGYCELRERNDLNWVLPIKKEVQEFIKDSGGIDVVEEEFNAFEYPNLYINNTKTKAVEEWIKGLPLAMVVEDNTQLGTKMKKYGYEGDSIDAVNAYYEIFSVFVAEKVFLHKNIKYSYDWSKYTKENK